MAQEVPLTVFTGTANRALSEAICGYLDIPVGRASVDTFPDGELLVRIEDDVRGRDCFLVQPTCPPVNDNLMELLVFIDCLRRASARRITVVLPYFGYARQDRKSEGRTPITSKLVANLITEAGANRILAVDLHAEQLQGFFDIPVDHLHAEPVIADYFRNLDLHDVVLVSPDVGNVKTANIYAQDLGGELAVIDKRRESGSEAVATRIIGDVKDRDVLMFDDMITTAGTICSAVNLVKEYGARSVRIGATHGIFAGPAVERLTKAPIDEIVVTDTVPLCEQAQKLKNLKVLSVAGLLGEAIHRIHKDKSVSAIFRKGYERSVWLKQ
ncbi:MAG: ribose-phosphate pyrophosphokinase [Sedimentisphaerales bacterium]|nr:ribose-phosphate pyrophosphokinase [Sedimentisphaerales bacterium]